MMVDMNGSPADISDRQRFTQWVDAHGKAVRGFLRAMIRREDLADELTQEVFCRAWQARSRYREQGSPRAYLLRIADRLACDHYRRPPPHVSLDEDGWKRYEPGSRSGEPFRAAAMVEEREQLQAALDQLTALQQRVLLLRYFGQLSFAEIAAMIGCPLSTALSHCHRGLEALRKLLVEKTP
jgi:RNA polymerase sigma-70 factor (ECF subfamily)